MGRYLLSVIDSVDPAYYPSEEDERTAEGAIDVFNDKLRAEGWFVFAEGLEPRSAAVTVDNRGSTAIHTDGPYVETKEFLGGFWVIDVPERDLALALAEEASRACIRKIELRAVAAAPDA